MLKVWLSRWHDGYFCVSLLKPKRAKMLGSDREAFYFRTGDPVAHRFICAFAIGKMFEDDPQRALVEKMQPMDEPIFISLAGKVV